jgi:hypothetical protein
MNKLHSTALALPISRCGSALPPNHFRIFVDRKADRLPMVFAIADPIRSGRDGPVKPAQWRVPNIVTDSTDEPAVMIECI